MWTITKQENWNSPQRLHTIEIFLSHLGGENNEENKFAQDSERMTYLK